MKKILFLLLIVLILFSACKSNNPLPIDTFDEANITSSITTATETTVATTTETVVTPTAEINLSALELLGYYIDNDNNIVIGELPQTEYDFEMFREYFFGTWDGWGVFVYGESYPPEQKYCVIDDSEKSNMYFHFLTGKLGRIGDNVVFNKFDAAGIGYVFWMDINEPDIMYSVRDLSYIDYIIKKDEYEKIPDMVKSLIKTDEPVNHPENGFMSSLRLIEIEVNYGIEPEMLVFISLETDDGFKLIKDDLFLSSRIYLELETDNMLLFNSSVYFEPAKYEWDFPVDIIYTIEKVNGEWVRTVEIDQEQLERIIEQL